VVVSATPLGLSGRGLDWPVRTRIRFGAAKARCLRSRRGRRARLAVNVLTVVGSHDAIITQVTLYGACIGGGRRLKRREIIALRLPSGWRVKARVQWRFGTRCWISFMRPVADFARILCEGAAVKSPGIRRRPTSNSETGMPSYAVLALPVRSSLANRLVGLKTCAKAYADRIRVWGAAKSARRDPRAG
jgi:hypothetical protein